MAMGTQRNSLRITQKLANAAKHFAIFFGHSVAHRVWQIQNCSSGIDSGLADLTEIVDIGAAGVFGGKFHLSDLLPAVTNHRADGFKSLFARHVQLHLQVKVRGGKENMQTRGRREFERFDRCVNIELFCARQCCDRHIAHFACDRLNRFQVAAGRDRETSFDGVHAKFRELASHPDLLLRLHGEARRLFPVAEGGVEYAHYVHGVCLNSSNADFAPAGQIYLYSAFDNSALY